MDFRFLIVYNLTEHTLYINTDLTTVIITMNASTFFEVNYLVSFSQTATFWRSVFGTDPRLGKCSAFKIFDSVPRFRVPQLPR